MSLVTSGEVDREVQRILSCTNAYAVLGLHPRDANDEQVRKAYDEKAALLKGQYRNKLAVAAKAKLSEAKTHLLDSRMRQKELTQYNHAQFTELDLRAQVDAIERRTEQLEERARAIANNAQNTS